MRLNRFLVTVVACLLSALPARAHAASIWTFDAAVSPDAVVFENEIVRIHGTLSVDATSPEAFDFGDVDNYFLGCTVGLCFPSGAYTLEGDGIQTLPTEPVLPGESASWMIGWFYPALGAAPVGTYAARFGFGTDPIDMQVVLVTWTVEAGFGPDSARLPINMPEPATLGLVLLGGAAAIVRRRGP